ncbi:MAG TPA: hypothetical protein DHW85_13305, partial [Lachnospiraceae bacterium]|nr:hypothetical protein [Lachnospiraceae bacterium]
MKKNFTTGLLSGICCSILLFAIIGTLYVMADGKANENDRNNNVRLEAEEDGQATLKNEDFKQ